MNAQTHSCKAMVMYECFYTFLETYSYVKSQGMRCSLFFQASVSLQINCASLVYGGICGGR